MREVVIYLGWASGVRSTLGVSAFEGQGGYDAPGN
jgi:hypothetical protein